MWCVVHDGKAPAPHWSKKVSTGMIPPPRRPRVTCVAAQWLMLPPPPLKNPGWNPGWTACLDYGIILYIIIEMYIISETRTSLKEWNLVPRFLLILSTLSLNRGYLIHNEDWPFVLLCDCWPLANFSFFLRRTYKKYLFQDCPQQFLFCHVWHFSFVCTL